MADTLLNEGNANSTALIATSMSFSLELVALVKAFSVIGEMLSKYYQLTIHKVVVMRIETWTFSSHIQ